VGNSVAWLPERETTRAVLTAVDIKLKLKPDFWLESGNQLPFLG